MTDSLPGFTAAQTVFAKPAVVWRNKRWGVVILLAGLLLPQILIFWPSLIGRRVLLPVDILTRDLVCIPQTPEFRAFIDAGTHNIVLSDLVLHNEPERQFAAREMHAGRLPLWNPNINCGAPFVSWPKYSPHSLLYCLFPTPMTLAWLQLAKTVVAGLGAYWFFRQVLHVGFWPAAFGAWCYPLSGFSMLWQGYVSTYATAGLPWLLCVTDRVIKRPRGWGGIVLAAVTCLLIVSCQVDFAGLVLLASGIFALWQEHGHDVLRRGWSAVIVLVAGWSLGFLLSMPYLLPLVEYAQTGMRIAERGAGAEERPPTGIRAVPQILLPLFEGNTQSKSAYLQNGNLLESAAGGYSGLFAVLLAAPLAWCNRRRRAAVWFWTMLGAISLGWTLNVPGLVHVLRLPGLNFMSWNRFVLVTAFAGTALSVIGLEELWAGWPERRRWFAGPVLLLVILGIWCGYFVLRLPGPVARLAQKPGINPDIVAEIQSGFRDYYLYGLLLCGLGLGGWRLVTARCGSSKQFGVLLGGMMVLELFWFGHDLNPQCDPTLYYPRLPVFEKLRAAPPGRILGVRCLPANLNMIYGLQDVRGYDAVDPLDYVQLLEKVKAPNFASPIYARTQWFVPQLKMSANGLQSPPLLSLLNVRYLVFRGSPPSGVKPYLQEADYWVWENADVLPRVFVPEQVEVIRYAGIRLKRLGAADFVPRKVAFVDQPLPNLPPRCQGAATIIREEPEEITVQAEMQTPGLLVLADRWDAGWRAYLNSHPVPILHANHALRGVELPAGTNSLVFRYEPTSFARGLQLFGAACVVLTSWLSVLIWNHTRA